MPKIAGSYQQHRQRVDTHPNWEDITYVRLRVVAILSTLRNCTLNPAVILQRTNKPQTTNRLLTAETCCTSRIAAPKKQAPSSPYITVVATSISITSSFIVLNEDNRYLIRFDAKILGADKAVDKWTLISSTPNFVGTIDTCAVYTTAVSDKSSWVPGEYTYVTVIAVTSDRRISKAYGRTN